ncbi:MAG: hypothetical protein Q4G24_13325 [Paracoccus sp. (in: a-proteobacteria)]|uniref:hypothetical protein n=1 Tax=Paracoccus sp. TaxID=267 RepID=UPI0026DFCCCF|nr:hypothetical protein [Paracoccus sp. (in: a-proteobacteria)]MDO5622440.1 hypothetical protein [Paracoccus sp. (in: a-proteobacteria)]
MTYKLIGYEDMLYPETRLLAFDPLNSFRHLDNPYHDMDRDDFLHQRSALEFVRDQMTDAQRAELAQVDDHLRQNATVFNEAFTRVHALTDRSTALDGWVEDAEGNTPAIPRSHWWWWPLPT